MAIDTVDCFYVKMKFSEYEGNTQLSCPDHSGYHKVKLHCNWCVFNEFKTLYNMNCHIRYFVREKFAYLCNFWQKSSCTSKKFWSNIHFTVFLDHYKLFAFTSWTHVSNKNWHIPSSLKMVLFIIFTDYLGKKK